MSITTTWPSPVPAARQAPSGAVVQAVQARASADDHFSGRLGSRNDSREDLPALASGTRSPVGADGDGV